MQASDNVAVYPELAGKVAVVTGGSGGIGAVTCRLLAANGARVAVNGRDRTRIQAVVDAIREGGGEAIGEPGPPTAAYEPQPPDLQAGGQRPRVALSSVCAGQVPSPASC